MRDVRLGGTGLRVSQLCLGTMTFGLQRNEATSVAILDRAAAGGITFLDTSDVYPIAGGLLSGKHHRETGPLAGTRFTHPTAGARYLERYWLERQLETVEALRPLAAEAGPSMAQMAVAWVLENPVVTSPIVGASRPEQLDDALAAVDKGLDAGLKTRLNDLTREYRWGDDIR